MKKYLFFSTPCWNFWIHAYVYEYNYYVCIRNVLPPIQLRFKQNIINKYKPIIWTFLMKKRITIDKDYIMHSMFFLHRSFTHLVNNVHQSLHIRKKMLYFMLYIILHILTINMKNRKMHVLWFTKVTKWQDVTTN